jgi:hypothetical protein
LFVSYSLSVPPFCHFFIPFMPLFPFVISPFLSHPCYFTALVIHNRNTFRTTPVITVTVKTTFSSLVSLR